MGQQSRRSSTLIRTLSIISLLGCVILILNHPLHAQQPSCTTDWASVPALYGTFTITGTGSDSTGSTDQSISGQAVLPQLAAGFCGWVAQGTAQMNGEVKLHDTAIPCAPSPADMKGEGPFLNPVFTVVFDEIVAGTYLLAPGGNVQASEFLCTGPPFPATPEWGWNPPTPEPLIPVPASVMPLSGEKELTAPTHIWGAKATNWIVTWNLSPMPDDNCDPCKKQQGLGVASTIAEENQSLGEDIPIIGTEFFLHYVSDRQVGRAGADSVAVQDARMLGGWTLSVHHALEPLLQLWCVGGTCLPYATEPKALFLGNGDTRSDAEVQSATKLNSKQYLTSEDGSEVYVFSGGLHIQTLRPMTGAVLYTFAYDSSSRLIKVTDANGNVTSITRNASGNPTAITSPYGQVTLLSVGANGNLSTITDPLGRVTKCSYIAGGLLSAYTDPKGNVYTFIYDSLGRLTQHSDPAGGSITLTRADTATGHTVTEKTVMGQTGSFQVDFSSSAASTTQQFTTTWAGLNSTETETRALGQLSHSATLPDGTSYAETFGADPRWGIQVPIAATASETRGNLTMNMNTSRAVTLGTAGNPFSLTSQTETETVNGRQYTSTYTGATRTYVETSPAGRAVTTILDPKERLASWQVGGLLAKQFTYDARGRLASVTQGTSTTGIRVRSLAYDAHGFLASATDPLGETTVFTHDADGNPTKLTLPDLRTINVSYDADGNLTTITSPLGASATHTLAFDKINNATKYTPPVVTGAGTTAFAYNADHQLTTITRPDLRTIAYHYDNAGRLSSVVTPTETVTYGYSSTGNLGSENIATGESITHTYNGPLPVKFALTGTVAGSVSRAYNNNFWVTTEGVGGGTTIRFTYDNDGLVTQAGSLVITRSSQTGLVTETSLGFAADSRSYNSFGELVGYTASYNGTPLYKVQYTRDLEGRILTKTETIGGVTTEYTYSYDTRGRLHSVTQNGALATTYTYDGDSNRLTATRDTVSVSGVYDLQDRLMAYGAISFTYTANGELESQIVGAAKTTYQYDVLGNLISVILPGGTITYIVDPQNRRVGKKLGSSVVAGYLYDDDGHLVAQLNSANAVVKQFVYGTGSATPDYMISANVKYRIFSDSLGSPRLVINTATGAIEERIDYDEFGNVIQDTSPGFQPFGFAGGLYDADTKLERFGARDYLASVGRWTSKDPILFAGGDINLYGYVFNDPINFTDSTGLTIFRVDVKDFIREQKQKRLHPKKKRRCKRKNDKAMDKDHILTWEEVTSPEFGGH